METANCAASACRRLPRREIKKHEERLRLAGKLEPHDPKRKPGMKGKSNPGFSEIMKAYWVRKKAQKVLEG